MEADCGHTAKGEAPSKRAAEPGYRVIAPAADLRTMKGPPAKATASLWPAPSS